MRVPCSKRHVLISEAIPCLHLHCSLVPQARCEKQQASSREKRQEEKPALWILQLQVSITQSLKRV